MTSRAGSKKRSGDELGPEVEVETHIEPLPADLLAGRDAAPARIAEVRELLSSLAVELPALGEVHDVRVRETTAGEIVNFHCQVDPARSVAKCMTWWTLLNGGCAVNFRRSSASSAMPNRGAKLAGESIQPAFGLPS